MKKKFLNPYKWKKRMKRGVIPPVHHSIGIEDRLSLRPETTHTGRWRGNPYERTKNSIKTRFELIFLGLVVMAIFGLCFFHPYFQVKTYSFQGLERVPEQQVKEFIAQQLDGKQLFFFYKNNYFSLNLKKLQQTLNTQYSFETLTLEKRFPHLLHIEIKEKPPALIYDDGTQYTLIGEKGEKLEGLRSVQPNEWQSIMRTVTSTNELGEVEMKQEEVARVHRPDIKNLVVANKNYPILYNPLAANSNQPLNISEKTVQGIKKWYGFLVHEANIPVTYIQLLEGGEEGLVKTTENWGIYIKFDNADEGFPIFQSLLPQINRSTVEYVDMRYLSRVYWK